MASAAFSREPMMQVRPGRDSANLMPAMTLGSMEPLPNEVLLVGLAEVDGNVVDGGEEDEGVGVAVLGEELAAHVLVDDGRDALVGALVGVVADDGDAAATAGDDDELVVEEVQDALVLDDLLGLGRGDDATVATAGVLDELHVGVGGLLGVSLLLGEEGADGLGGVLERGILGVDLDLGDDGGDVPALVLLVHGSADGLLQVVADVALGHGAALGEVHARDLGVGLVGEGEGLLDHADLRAVAVGDDDLVTLLDDLEQRGSSGADALDLLLGGVAEGVAAEGDYDTVGLAVRHVLSPSGESNHAGGAGRPSNKAKTILQR